MTDDQLNINISVTFRHTEPTDALKNYATEKIGKIVEKYSAYNCDVQIVLEIEKRDHSAEVNIHSKQFNVSGKATTGDLYSAIDEVADRVEAQVRKQKDKAVDHKHQPTPEV